VKREKYYLQGATMAPLTMTTSGTLSPAADKHLKDFVSVACSIGLHWGVWLRIARKYLRCASVHGGSVAFTHCCLRLGKRAGEILAITLCFNTKDGGCTEVTLLMLFAGSSFWVHN
jgi:hypothetical protein